MEIFSEDFAVFWLPLRLNAAAFGGQLVVVPALEYRLVFEPFVL